MSVLYHSKPYDTVLLNQLPEITLLFELTSSQINQQTINKIVSEGKRLTRMLEGSISGPSLHGYRTPKGGLQYGFPRN